MAKKKTKKVSKSTATPKSEKAWAWLYEPPYGGIVIPSVRSTRRDCKAFQQYNTGHISGGKAIRALIVPVQKGGK